MSPNPYDPPPEIEGNDDPEPQPEIQWQSVGKFAAIIIGVNGLAIAFGGTPMVGTIVILIGVLLWFGGRGAVDE